MLIHFLSTLQIPSISRCLSRTHTVAARVGPPSLPLCVRGAYPRCHCVCAREISLDVHVLFSRKKKTKRLQHEIPHSFMESLLPHKMSFALFRDDTSNTVFIYSTTCIQTEQSIGAEYYYISHHIYS